MNHYNPCIVIAILKRKTYEKKVITQDGTTKDEQGNVVPVYVDTYVTTPVEHEPLYLDLPFKPYSLILSENIDLNDMENEGKEVMAKVSYRIVDFQNIPNEIEKAEKFKGNLGRDFEKIKKDKKYKEHYKGTKTDKLSTFDKDGVKTEYDGIDKDDPVKFTVWDEMKEVEEVLIDG